MGEARSKSLHDLIWTIAGKGLAEGRAETEKHLVGRLLKELRKIGSGSTETASEVRMAVLAVAGAVKTLSEDRNLIVHGTWGELDGVPTVGVVLQLEDDRHSNERHPFESFPPDRLRDLIRDVTACRDQAMAIIAQWLKVLEARGERARPTPPDLDVWTGVGNGSGLRLASAFGTRAGPGGLKPFASKNTPARVPFRACGREFGDLGFGWFGEAAKWARWIWVLARSGEVSAGLGEAAGFARVYRQAGACAKSPQSDWCFNTKI